MRGIFSAMVSKRVFYEGRVQGVGFRWTVKALANEFEVVGEVQNLIDGRVELCVQGMEMEVEEFLQAIRQSGLSGHIAREVIEPIADPPRWRGFQIRGG